jgi:hypothetical protein
MIAGNGTEQRYTRTGSGEEVQYMVCANAPLIFETTLARTQITYHTPGTIRQVNVSVTFNGLASNSKVYLMVNGSTVGSPVTIAGGVVGTVAITLAEHIADGDEVNWKLVVDADDPGTAIDFSFVSAVFEADADTAVRHAATNFAQEVNGLTNYAALSDDCSTLNTAEVNARFDCNAAGTIKNLFVYVSQWTNTTNFSMTVRLRVNGVDSTLTVNYAGAGPAPFILEDTSHAIAIVADDDVNYSIVTSGVGSCTLEIVSVEWVSTAKQFHSVYGRTGAGFTQAKSLTKYSNAGGTCSGSFGGSPESYYRIPIGFKCKTSNLTAYTSSNTITDIPPADSEDLLYVRKNGTDTGLVVALTRGVGAQVEDTSGLENFVATDELSMKCVTGGIASGTLTFQHFGMTFLNTEPVSFVPRVMIV